MAQKRKKKEDVLLTELQSKSQQNGVRRSVERRTGPNPRTFHPSTSEIAYTNEEMELLKAMDSFKITTGRTFPTVTDYLKVLRGLGYSKKCLECEARRERENRRTKGRGA